MLERREPELGLVRVLRQRGEDERWVGPREQPLETPAALVEGAGPEIVPVRGEEVERNEDGGRFAAQPLDTRLRGMEAREKRREVCARLRRDDDLAVEDKGVGHDVEEGVDQLREVTRERALVAAAQVDALADAEGETAKAVPLRLVEVAASR